MKMIVYSYEPHSEFMVDLGYWKSSDRKFKLLKYLEDLAGKESDFILTGTSHMVARLEEEKSKAVVYRAPTAVDDREFYFRTEGRLRIRKQLKIEDKNVFLYLGKFGGLYYTGEIPEMCSGILKEIPDAFFLIVTSNSYDEINTLFARWLPRESFHITGDLSYEEVKEYISAADFGISGVPPSPSQKFRSPTKVAEYLLCGIPFITTNGVAEDDQYARQYNIGVVVDDFGYNNVSPVIKHVKRLLTEDKESLRKRCRKIAMEYRSKQRIDKILLDIYSGLS